MPATVGVGAGLLPKTLRAVILIVGLSSMSFSAKEIVDARFVKELEDGGMRGKSLQKINRLIRVP